MEVLPSRVIFWTTPYKQLYKDPALVVALPDGTALQLDKLYDQYERGDNSAGGDFSLRNLLVASIVDADAKYAALWKLYVFISDGLFYSGIVEKLYNRVNAVPLALREDQEKRLTHCQMLVVKALDIIKDDWSDCCSYRDTNSRNAQLLESMAPDKFEHLVNRWEPKLRDDTYGVEVEVRKLCRVDIRHYVHRWDHSQMRVERNCRDIRYKVDNSGSRAWDEAKKKHVGDSERYLVDALEEVLGANASTLTDLEFRDLVGLFDEQAQDTLRDMRNNATDKEQVSSCFKTLFWEDFPRDTSGHSGSMEPTKDTTKVGTATQAGPDERPAPASRAAKTVGLPKTHREFKRWLSREARVLEPHVRKQLMTNMERIAAFVTEEVDESMRIEVLEDIHDRLDNEARKIFNHVKVDSIIETLTRRWHRKDGLT